MSQAIRTVFSVFASAAVLGCSAATTKSSSASTKADPELITTAEISAQNFRNAYEAVERLRPEWLRKRDAATRMGMTVRGGAGVQTDAGSGLVAYLDNTRLGGVEGLRDISAAGIASIQYMDAAKATAQLPGLGSSSISGAIVVHSRRD